MFDQHFDWRSNFLSSLTSCERRQVCFRLTWAWVWECSGCCRCRPAQGRCRSGCKLPGCRTGGPGSPRPPDSDPRGPSPEPAGNEPIGVTKQRSYFLQLMSYKPGYGFIFTDVSSKAVFDSVTQSTIKSLFQLWSWVLHSVLLLKDFLTKYRAGNVKNQYKDAESSSDEVPEVQGSRELILRTPNQKPCRT